MMSPFAESRRCYRTSRSEICQLAGGPEHFSVERLEQHSHTLAAAQKVTDASNRGNPVQPRSAENSRVLVESYLLARAIKDERSFSTTPRRDSERPPPTCRPR